MQIRHLLATLIGLAALAATPTAVASETRWYTHEEGLANHGLPIAEGMFVTTSGTGTLAVSLRRKGVKPSMIKAECSVEIMETVWNGSTQAFAETQSLGFKCEPYKTPATNAEVCPHPVVTSNNLPGWPAKAIGEEHPVNVEMEKVALTFKCEVEEVEKLPEGPEKELAEGITLEGTLVVKQGDADEQCEGTSDDVDNELRFDPTIERTSGVKEQAPRLQGSGKFENKGYSLSLIGLAKLGARGAGVTLEVFPCKSKGLGK